eukprot:TRINITY_DN2548_c0_g1_i1.p1 TRINITY_DN2548_c0_g1~~TRINITY_DN2548_c0_g1_i1.p1  ORF type:complete len:301 (-),score=51.77 TRINITY_DN2548_c0_g1_i1:26-928(-)
MQLPMQQHPGSARSQTLASQASLPGPCGQQQWPMMQARQAGRTALVPNSGSYVACTGMGSTRTHSPDIVGHQSYIVQPDSKAHGIRACSPHEPLIRACSPHEPLQRSGHVLAGSPGTPLSGHRQVRPSVATSKPSGYASPGMPGTPQTRNRQVRPSMSTSMHSVSSAVTVPSHEQRLHEREQELKGWQRRLEVREEKLTDREARLADREAGCAAREAECREEERRLAELKRHLDELQLEEREQQLKEREESHLETEQERLVLRQHNSPHWEQSQSRGSSLEQDLIAQRELTSRIKHGAQH